MFIDFFFLLREHGVPVSVTEWLALMEGLSRGLAGGTLTGFYHLCRAVCVKNEGHFDTYDQCFAAWFHGVEATPEALAQVEAWLEAPIPPRELTPEEVEALERLDLEELRRRFEERLGEQTERHDGGSRWIGTGGSSPFGHGGTHPTGVRVGGEGRGRSAMQIASERRFRNLRHDVVLDVRQVEVALRRLRQLGRYGSREELDLEETVDETARNAGDIELVFRPERKNTVKLLLLMDVGGSMTAYTRLCERIFSAAHAATHFKAFKHYYFHNCVYETLFTDMARREGEPTARVLSELDPSWFCVVVGDAAMHPYELTAPGGAIDYFHQNSEAGLVWLQRIATRLPRAVWLNPEPPRYWESTATIQLIKRVFEMHPLTLDGLEAGIASLLRRRT